WVVGSKDLGAGLGVLPIEEAVAVGELEFVVVGLDLLHLQALVPRIEESRLGTAVVLDVALAARHRAHFLAGGILVGIVGPSSVSLSPLFNRGQVGNRRVAAIARCDRADAGR